MRFVPPINLYIFSSIFFFILVSHTVKVGFVTVLDTKENYYRPTYYVVPSFGTYNFGEIAEMTTKYRTFNIWELDSADLLSFINEVDSTTLNPVPLYKMLQLEFKWDWVYLYYYYFTQFLWEPYLGKHKNYSEFDAPFAVFCTDYFHTLSKLLFVLMPLLGWLIHLTFRKPGFLYVDHAILSLHSHLFLFASMAAQFLLGCFMDLSYLWCLLLSVLVIPGIYFIASMRKIYGFSWLRTGTVGGILWCFYIAFAFTFTLVVNIVLFRYA